MIVFAQICRQIERIQGVTVIVIFASDEQSFVFAKLSRSGKQTVVGSFIQVVSIVLSPVVWVSRQSRSNCLMLEVKWIVRGMSVDCSITDEPGNGVRGQSG